MGVVEAWAFWDMTPKEINGRMTAFSANIKREIEHKDILAWMIGNYVACGYHNPKKYPKKPTMSKEALPDKEMGEDDMKTVLTTFAEIHNTIEGVE